jgi:hypothetical protein
MALVNRSFDWESDKPCEIAHFARNFHFQRFIKLLVGRLKFKDRQTNRREYTAYVAWPSRRWWVLHATFSHMARRRFEAQNAAIEPCANG